MKKLLSALLALMILCSCSSLETVANADATRFETTFTDTAEYSCSRWLATDKNRAMLAVFLYVDYLSQKEKVNFTPDWFSAIVVGKISDIDCFACIQGEGETILLTYTPLLKYGTYTIIDGISGQSGTILKLIAENAGGTDTKIVNQEEILGILIEIYKILS